MTRIVRRGVMYSSQQHWTRSLHHRRNVILSKFHEDVLKISESKDIKVSVTDENGIVDSESATDLDFIEVTTSKSETNINVRQTKKLYPQKS